MKITAKDTPNPVLVYKSNIARENVTAKAK